MAQPDTIARRLTPTSRLVLECTAPGCGARFEATRAQAIKRFGPTATAYAVENLARCVSCGANRIKAMIADARELAGPKPRDRITAADVDAMNGQLATNCAPCRVGSRPDVRNPALR
ncbi:MAG: hypothetical protein V4466_02945, partial [Pseudomonadota bacterium]